MGRILVIDDSLEVVDFFQEVLAPLGHEVVGAYDGEAGLRRFGDELPDLVFLDLLLPRKDGGEVCAAIKRSEHGLITPVAILTGVYKTASKLEVMKQYGAVDYLTKPISVAKVTALVDWILGAKPDEDGSVAEDEELERLDLGQDARPLDQGALLDLLRFASRERWSGVIAAGRGRARKALLIADGKVAGVRSNLGPDGLERVLMAMRKVSPAEMSAVRGRYQDPGQLLDRLVGNGALAVGSEAEVLRCQALTSALGLFRWSTGWTRALPGETLDCHRIDPPIETAHLALIGLRKNPWLREAAARETLTATAVFQRLAGPAQTESYLARRERDVLELIDGERSLDELRQVANLAQIAIEDALAVLVGSGFVARREADGSALPALTASGQYLAGDLAERPFAEVLGWLGREKATGLLSLEGPCRRSFSLHAGDLVFARSTDPADVLGQVLLRQGLVTEAALDQALTVQRERRPDRKLGALLVEMGGLTLAALEEASRFQLQRIVESTFDWTEGAYVFEPSPALIGPTLRVDRALPDWLRAGIAAMDARGLERRWLMGESLWAARRTAEAVPDELVLQDDERALLELLAERVEVDHLAAGDPGILRSLQLLLALGLIRLEARPRPAPAPPRLPAFELPTPAGAGPRTAIVVVGGGGDGDGEEETLPVIELEATLPEAASGLAAGPAAAPALAGPALDQALLAFLRAEVMAERRATERDLRRLERELGALRERESRLAEENRELRERLAALAPAPTALPEHSPATPAAAAAARKPRAAARPRAARKKPVPALAAT